MTLTWLWECQSPTKLICLIWPWPLQTANKLRLICYMNILQGWLWPMRLVSVYDYSNNTSPCHFCDLVSSWHYGKYTLHAPDKCQSWPWLFAMVKVKSDKLVWLVIDIPTKIHTFPASFTPLLKSVTLPDLHTLEPYSLGVLWKPSCTEVMISMTPEES